MKSSLRSSGLCRGVLMVGLGIASALRIVPVHGQQMCGGATYPFPYTDVAAVGAPFCPGIMEAYVTGVSKGTSPTTFSPNETVSRVQMTTFLQRSLDQGLVRTARRAALNQWWTPQNAASMQTIALGAGGQRCAADGVNIWVPTVSTVVEVEAHTGKVLGTWTGVTQGNDVLPAAGMIYVTGTNAPGNLYVLDPTLPPGAVIPAATLPNYPEGITFDGTHIWTANASGSVSIITPQSPYTVTNVSTGFNSLYGILYDGADVWVTDFDAGKLFKLDAAGGILQTVSVGAGPLFPVFDGTNIWVPSFFANSITVVQASSGNVVATIGADATNLLNDPVGAAFDGERVLVANQNGASVTVFKAADLSFIANVPDGAVTIDACSDGINFWVPIGNNLLRF